MPVVGIPVARLRDLLRQDLGREELLRHLGYLGCDVEGYTQLARVRCAACGAIHEMTDTEEIPPTCETCGGDLRANHVALSPLEVIRMELLAVRPDMFDPGGLARALRGYLNLESGAVRYEIGPPALRVHVDPSVRDSHSYRPYIACAVVEGLTLDEDALKIVMKLQENLHWAIGRNRKHASIGVYDLDRVSPDINYTTEDPERFGFTPLGAAGTGERYALSLRRILTEHPKGIAFAHLLKGLSRYPILRDRNGLVLSMPPIINSEETKVTLATRRFFIDVTGLSARVVSRVLNIIVTSLAENFPGTRLQAVEVHGPGTGESWTTPDLTPQRMTVSVERAARVLGIPVTPEEGARLLAQMRHDVRLLANGELAVEVPAYRNDILHEMDLVEDLAIAYGYHRITPSLVPTFTVGGARPIEVLADSTRAMLCGLGFLEVMTLLLTNPEAHDVRLGRAPGEDAVEIANPASSEQTMLRTSLLPGLLETFRRNLMNPLPQRVFEIGEVTLLDPAAETGARDVRHFACGMVAPRVGFEDVKAVAEAIRREFACDWQLQACRGAPFLAGRAAGAFLTGDPRPVVHFGEVDPAVLERCGIQNPVVLLEGDLELLGGLAG